MQTQTQSRPFWEKYQPKPENGSNGFGATPETTQQPTPQYVPSVAPQVQQVGMRRVVFDGATTFGSPFFWLFIGAVAGYYFCYRSRASTRRTVISEG